MKSDVKKLIVSCDLFNKLATEDLSKIVATYKAAINNEVTAGINAINRLVTTNKVVAESQAITELDSIFGKIGNQVTMLDANNIEASIKSLLMIAENGLFYTSSVNAGTGFDPLTRAGGANSPGAHLDKIYDLIKKLDAFTKQ